MDEQTKTYIALGAATAANCVPCFENYYSKAEKLGINKRDVQEAVDIAVKVRGGAHMVIKGSIQKILTGKSPQSDPCCNGTSPCCD